MFNNQKNQSELTALLDSANYFEMDLLRNSAEFIDHDFRLLITEVFEIEIFVSMVLSSKLPGFKVNKKRYIGTGVGIDRQEVVMLPLAQKYFGQVIGMFSALSPEYRYNPHVELFQDSIVQLGLEWEYLNTPRAISSRTGKEEYQLFNDLIDRIREGSKSREFRVKFKRIKELASRNFASAVIYINNLFAKYSKLLVLRVDFGYSKMCTLGITLDQAKRDLAHFFNNLKKNKSLSEHLVGNIWRWEFSGKKGYHCHCLFFYDGQEVQKDEFRGKQLGEYWQNVVTPGRGHYWNVNTVEKKEEYRRKGLLGIGMIHRDDEALRSNLLQHITQYFLKMEQHILAKTLANHRGRLFGKGRGLNKWKKVESKKLLPKRCNPSLR